MVSRSLVDFAREEARNHEIDYPHKVVAVFHRRNRAVAWGYNQPHKTHPKANTPYKTIHAEFAALRDLYRQVGDGTPLHVFSLYVHRIRRDGRDGISRPCVFCRQMLIWAGIKDISWSVSSA